MAAKLVAAGWSDGAEPARDAAGDPVQLYVGTGGGTSRAGVNPAAARFSAYGAVAAVLARHPVQGANVMWTKLADTAAGLMVGRRGGTNHVHPLVGFNAAEGRTAAEVVSLLEMVANELDPARAIEAGRAT